MVRKKIIQKSLLILFCASFQIVASSINFEENPEKVFPLRETPYTFADLEEKFSPALGLSSKGPFLASLKILFHPDFPPPQHPNGALVKGYQCLYRKVIEAHQEKTEEEKSAEQLHALYQLLGLHKKTIATLDPALAELIAQALPCANCIKSAKTEFLGQGN